METPITYVYLGNIIDIRRLWSSVAFNNINYWI